MKTVNNLRYFNQIKYVSEIEDFKAQCDLERGMSRKIDWDVGERFKDDKQTSINIQTNTHIHTVQT